MDHRALPIVVLAGSDRRPATLPEQGRDKHPLAGYKAVDVRVGDRTLVDAVVERLAQSGCFDPIHVAGPRRVFEGRIGRAVLVDTDGSLGQNVAAAAAAVRATHPDAPIAFTVCDILPEPETLARLIALYRECAPCDFWAPLVRAPERSEKLGASAWKPAYGIIPEGQQQPVRVLPGHFVVADPRALRLALIYRLVDLGYRTRNRSIDSRRGEMIRGVLADVLAYDLRSLLRLRPPTLAWSVLRTAIPAANLLRQGTITQRRLEDTVRRIFVKARHRRAHPARRVVLPVIDALAMARDIDTEEEARELGGTLAS